ncbi:MAG: vWA domain-containing protein [Planctomycetota bacterium]|jgi:hypothetical protein
MKKQGNKNSKTNLKKLFSVIALCMGLMMPLAGAQDEASAPCIQLAILLDTSGSMSGLINQARTELWKIVNEFATMKQDGKAPLLEVALFEYGKDSLPSDEGYLRMILPLTTDLDKVSQELFALQTNGGSEYCGWVIHEAIEHLTWSENPNDLKTIFIAGNEAFTQGQMDYKVSCKAAITRGVTVNTIFCGNHDEGVNTSWKDGATLADGSYMSIDHNRAVPHIDAPQDAEITRLSTELNDTYIPYGAEGAVGMENQAEQDKNAQSVGRAVAAQRAATKSMGQYRNDHWDLVDAIQNETVKLEEVKQEDLPENMQAMNAEERQAFVDDQLEKRKKIQKDIQELSDARKVYVAEKLKEQAESGENTFDKAVIDSIHKLADKQNFVVEKP